MKPTICLLLVNLFWCALASAQTPAIASSSSTAAATPTAAAVVPEDTSASVIPLWSGRALGALGEADVDTPTLTRYVADPAIATGAAMVILPGGGYGGLAKHEGEGYARWLAKQGVSSFVVKYRLGKNNYRHPVMLNDAARAVRLVRSRAEEWKVDVKRVGIMGSSAGGHLASTLVTQFDAGRADDADPVERQSSRPDLGVLCYPVITMGKGTHTGSRHNLLGANPSPELIEALSSEKQVKADTPPCFVWHTWEDNGVSVDNSLLFAEALRAKGVRFELHIYEKGGHGIGLGKNGTGGLHRWTDDLRQWLIERDFIRATKS